MNARIRYPLGQMPQWQHRPRLRFIEGGDPAGAPGAPAGDPAPTGDPAAPPAPVPAPPRPAPGQAFSQEYVSELREEAKANRLKAQTAETTNATLAADLEKVRAELAALQTAGNIDKAITAAGGNTIAGLAVKGAGVLDGIDLTDQAKVDAAVKAFIDEHPELKAAPGATRSTVPSPGGTGEQGQRPTSIADALARASR